MTSPTSPILGTKLYKPPSPPKTVARTFLVDRLNKALDHKMTLISAPAGFGKTTLASAWVAGCERPTAWLSLDESDSDSTRFLAYLVAALRTIAANIGEGVLAALRAPEPPPAESLLTALLNEIHAVPESFALVLDDYHVIDAKPVDDILAFLIDHLPGRMHLVIITREDPQVPLARLRAKGELIELRVADLRFGTEEAAEFLNDVHGLRLSTDDIAALDARTEGWIAGLQLAAISMQGLQDPASFIKSFTGSHHFVMDYLVEEVLQQQPGKVQEFLLSTSILDRLCGPLCDAVLLGPTGSGQSTLEYLERANLFIVPLDNERRWYRYHHLFADLLRQRLQKNTASAAVNVDRAAAELHVRASRWYEDNGLEIEAFQHAAACGDYERAERLIEGKGMPLHFRGAVAPVLGWLETLPTSVMDAWPSLWTAFASTLLVTGQTTRVEQVLQAAEAALLGSGQDDKTRDLIGRLAATRATAAAGQQRVEDIIAQSHRALEYLHPNNVAFRTSTAWKLGFAYQLQGNRAAAKRAYTEVVSIGRASGNTVFTLMAEIGLGQLEEAENQLPLAVETYRRVLQLFGDHPLPFASEVHLGLARIFYEWNDLDAAERHRAQGAQLARLLENTDRFLACSVLLARLELARGAVARANDILVEAYRAARQQNFIQRIPEIAALHVVTLLRQGELDAAARLADEHEIPISQARVHLARREPSAALAILQRERQQAEETGSENQRLAVTVLQAISLSASGDKGEAAQLLGEALALAEPGGFIRTFVDEGLPMAELLSGAASTGVRRDHVAKLLAAFDPGKCAAAAKSSSHHSSLQSEALVEPLSPRELEVLQLIARGLSNREISERLFVALVTVKGHNQRIFDKLQVRRRTEAVARARDLGLL